MNDPDLDQALERIRALTLTEIRHTPQDDPRDYEHEYYTQTEIDRYGDEAADAWEAERERTASQ